MTDYISILKEIGETAKKGIDLLKKHFPSEVEKEILRSASKTGEFKIYQADQLIYPIIQAGEVKMGKVNDPASLAIYYEAFKKLCENGYIEHASGILFHLTSDGLIKARKV